MPNVIKSQLRAPEQTREMNFSADVSDCCVLRLPVIHLATVMSEAGADLNAPGGLLPGQRTWGSGSVGRVSDDALVSLAAPGGGAHTHLVLAWHVCTVSRQHISFSTWNHGIDGNVIGNMRQLSFFTLLFSLWLPFSCFFFSAVQLWHPSKVRVMHTSFEPLFSWHLPQCCCGRWPAPVSTRTPRPSVQTGQRAASLIVSINTNCSGSDDKPSGCRQWGVEHFVFQNTVGSTVPSRNR